MKPSLLIDLILMFLKWPAGLFTAALLPACLGGTWDLLARIIGNPFPILWFLAGFGAYLGAWRWVLKHPLWGTWFSTLEHELTHALFALLTLHPVTSIKTTWKSGGRMSYLGKGNWLITIAPYFFPTLCLLVLVPLAWTNTATETKWLDFLLGVTLAYHAISTHRETHREQTDLKEVGFTFAWLFLPAANLLTHTTILAFAHGGTPLAISYMENVFANTYQWIGDILG